MLAAQRAAGLSSSSRAASSSCSPSACHRLAAAARGHPVLARRQHACTISPLSSSSRTQRASTAHSEPMTSTSSTSSSSDGQQQQPTSTLPAYGLLFVTATLPLLQALAAVLGMLTRAVAAVRHAVAGLFPRLEGVSRQDVRDSVRSLAGNVRLMALFVAPLARAASSESLTAVYARTFERAAFGFAKMYLFCLFMRVLLSWFPEIDWNAQPWTFLRLITEPYLQIYRGLLPPLFGQLDFTPLFGFLILQDVVEVMAPTYTMGLHDHDTSTRWTTSDVMCYLDGF